MKRIIGVAVAAFWLAGAAQAAAPHTAAFIGAPTNFNGFEGLGSNTNFLGPYTEDGVTVEYVGTYTGIWSTSQAGEGQLSWYANGGGIGYTRITLAGLADFSAIQVLAGSGLYDGLASLNYELLDDGQLVQTGVAGALPGFPNGFVYYGFSGGGFDEVRLQGNNQGLFDAATHEALALDAITVGSVPEPAGWVLMIGGFAMAGATLRRRRGFASRLYAVPCGPHRA